MQSKYILHCFIAIIIVGKKCKLFKIVVHTQPLILGKKMYIATSYAYITCKNVLFLCTSDQVKIMKENGTVIGKGVYSKMNSKGD